MGWRDATSAEHFCGGTPDDEPPWHDAGELEPFPEDLPWPPEDECNWQKEATEAVAKAPDPGPAQDPQHPSTWDDIPF